MEQMIFPTFKNEQECYKNGYDFVVGCDEVGVGPLAGPVVAAACVLNPETIQGYRSKSKWYYRVRDSKTTYEDERPDLAQEIKDHSIAYGIGEVSADEIDRLNIHNAALLAMKLAVIEAIKSLRLSRELGDSNIYLFLDGRFTIKDLDIENVMQKSVVDGDCSILSISAASIVAKVHRDRLLKDMDLKFPQFGFGKHKGYNTKQHREAIIQNGVTDYHRRSFLKNLIQD